MGACSKNLPTKQLPIQDMKAGHKQLKEQKGILGDSRKPAVIQGAAH